MIWYCNSCYMIQNHTNLCGDSKSTVLFQLHVNGFVDNCEIYNTYPPATTPASELLSQVILLCTPRRFLSVVKTLHTMQSRGCMRFLICISLILVFSFLDHFRMPDRSKLSEPPRSVRLRPDDVIQQSFPLLSPHGRDLTGSIDPTISTPES
jgi:hypothetical protein